MPWFFLYLLKLSISLGGVWLFYQGLLRRLTFYTWNRWYLIAYSLFSFFIPFINIAPMIERGPADRLPVISYIPGIADYASPAGRLSAPARIESFHWDGWTLFGVVLAAGAVFLLVRLCIRYVSILNIGRKARLVYKNGLKIYEVDQPIIPFSFRNAIYINPGLHTDEEWKGIILHEYVHVRQKHTVDILFSEFLCVFNWYNPFAWMIRHSIRQNLEFIADKQVLEKGLDKKGYQYHLLNVIGQGQYRLANNFNFSSLKKRIVMMNKIRSARMHLVKFLFILPLLGILLVAFRDKYGSMLPHGGGPVFVNHAGLVLDIADRKPLAGVTVLEKNFGLRAVTDGRGYYKLRFPVMNDSIRVHLDFIRAGYDSSQSEFYMPSVKQSVGRVDVCVLYGLPHASARFYIGVPYMKPCPVDPGYEDVLKAAQENERINVDIVTSMKMRTGHPEVSLFYTFEDHSKQIVIYADGHIEKYGYPGGPSIARMEEKFGPLPDMLKKSDPAAEKGYMARWSTISAAAEKQFHTSNPNVRTIVFPGDSRVIAIPLSGKPQVYDMDNADPKERPAFEKLYGKLPDAVPEPGNSAPDHRIPNLPVQYTRSGGMTDTVIKPVGYAASSRTDTLFVSHLYNSPRDASDVLYVLDGKELEKDDLNQVKPNSIASINILKGQSAVDKYGEKGKNGVVEITSKDYFFRTHPGEKLPSESRPASSRPVDTVRSRRPGDSAVVLIKGNDLTVVPRTDSSSSRAVIIWGTIPNGKKGLVFVDGTEVSWEEAHKIAPEEIKSMDVLKGESAVKTYGDRAKDGAILITLKK